MSFISVYQTLIIAVLFGVPAGGGDSPRKRKMKLDAGSTQTSTEILITAISRPNVGLDVPQ